MAKSNDHVDQHKLFTTSVPEMSDGYYSGDKPNLNLRAFVEEHIKEHPYDAGNDYYNVPAFDRAIEATKANAIYNMHTYWSKKPHDAIRQYIKHYTEPGDLVLDPFAGSGGTALAALIDNRKAIAIDRSPAATFIAKNYCTPISHQAFTTAFDLLKRAIEKEINWLYETTCEKCGGKANTVFTVYSQVYQCPRCLSNVPLYDCIESVGTTGAGKEKKITVCPTCHPKGVSEEISTRSKKVGFIPVLFGYECENVKPCRPKRGQRYYLSKDSKYVKHDLRKTEEIEKLPIPYTIPTEKMMHCEKGEPWGLLWRPYLEGIESVSDFFTKRNLWALLSIKNAIMSLPCDKSTKDFMMCGLTAILFKCSKMMGYRDDGIGRVMTGTYWIPPLCKDINVWLYYKEWFGDAERHVDLKNMYLKGNKLDLMISTETATELTSVPSNSVDYIFTDPPYSWKVQYGESNFLWEAFLGFDTHWHEHEIIVNEFRGKTEGDWSYMMRKAISECYRVLKPGRWLSLCYHDTSEGTWSLIQDIFAESGFIVDQSSSAIFIDADQKSIKQITADKVSKRDLVINFRKPKSGEAQESIFIDGTENEQTFSDKVRFLIRDYVQSNPGTTKDKIYDEIVSHMVRAGRMEAHNFDELLLQMAEPTEGSNGLRWYLKDSSLDIIDAAESAKEDAAAEKISTFIAGYLAKHLTSEGVHYSDIFEQFVYTVKDKPRRPLAEWLLDYFFKTGEGTYRLSSSDEEKRLKAEGRSKGTQRCIKRYIAFLQQGVAIPDKERPNDSTLAEWIRHCKRSGLYEQGKLLYEKGGLNLDGLGEEAMVNVEEDYQVCARMLARGGTSAETKPKRGRKAQS